MTKFTTADVVRHDEERFKAQANQSAPCRSADGLTQPSPSLTLPRLEGDEDGVRMMKESLARQARNNLYIDRSAYCSLLAGEMQRRGLPGAQEFVGEGLSCMERFGERHFESELHRLRDELAGGSDRRK